jgi:hypothetical protein
MRSKVASEQDTDCLGIARLPERGRAGDVAKEDGERLSLFARLRGGRGRRPALWAEPERLGRLMPTGGTDRHPPSLEGQKAKDN